MKSELSLSIEHLYKVFGTYHFDATEFKNHSCPCCYDRKVGVLATTPLHALNSDDLECYQISSIYTIGTIAHYKHFLPRILELIAQPNNDLISNFLISDKLTYAEWETWPEEEIKAIDLFFEALSESFIHLETVSDYYFSDLLQLLNRYGVFTKFINSWFTSISSKNYSYIVSGVLYGFPFKVNDNQYQLITNHLFSKNTLDTLQDIYFKTTDIVEANLISITYTILENKHPITFH